MKTFWVIVAVGVGLAGTGMTADPPPVPEPALSAPDKPAERPSGEAPPVPEEIPAQPVREPLPAPEKPAVRETLREEQIVGMLRFVAPRHADYQYALGLELQWARWFGPSFGVAVCGGVERWAIEAREYFENSEVVLRPRVDGSAVVLPFGGSLLYRSGDLGSRLRLTAELGLRFTYIISDVTMTYDFIDHYGQPTRVQDTVDLDPRLLAVGRLELTGRIEQPWDWFIGGGYQKDFAKGENWLYEEVANDLSGIVISLGVRRRL